MNLFIKKVNAFTNMCILRFFFYIHKHLRTKGVFSVCWSVLSLLQQKFQGFFLFFILFLMLDETQNNHTRPFVVFAFSLSPSIQIGTKVHLYAHTNSLFAIYGPNWSYIKIKIFKKTKNVEIVDISSPSSRPYFFLSVFLSRFSFPLSFLFFVFFFFPYSPSCSFFLFLLL